MTRHLKLKLGYKGQTPGTVIAAYGWMTPEEAETVTPRVVFVDERNRITELRTQERTPLCLAAFTPSLAEIALAFGAYEFFWLALFGVAM